MKKDFFISYTSADRSWADWIAQELENAGYTTVHQSWDFRPGANFISEMKKALEDCQRTIAVYSPNYFNSGFGEDEWTAAFADRSLLPVRVRECEIPKLLRTRVYIDLAGMEATAARDALLRGVNPAAVRPRTPVEFPGDRRRFPGTLPEVWEVPQGRNPNFTGRDQMLRDLHDALQSGGAAAIAGLGGVGKSTLALEYAYRFASEYNLVWWLRADEPSALASDFARIAGALKLPEKDLASQPEIIAAVRKWLEHNSAWLLVFDNAPGPQACEGSRPRSNAGHVLITSRNPVWRGAAEPLPLRQLSREESIAFLKKRTGRDEPDAANALSEAVGDLPLALEHAAGYIESTGISIAEYGALYREYSKELLEPVQATWRISLDKLRTENPPALDLLHLCAWLAPDNIPRDMLQSTPENPLAFNKSIAALRRYSLIQAADDVIGVHRLVQKVTRDGLDEAGQRRWAEAALNVVNDAFPGPRDVRNWPACAVLLPHAVEVTKYAEALSVAVEECGRLLNVAALYEEARAQLGSAEQFSRRALAAAEKVYGPDDLTAAIYASNVGQILQAQGDLTGALEYGRRALQIAEKVCGSDHETVAIYASNVGQILKDQGDLDGALQLARRALKIGETVYGPDDPMVATLANNIGAILKTQGNLTGALQYTRRALEIDEKVYGPDHPKVAIRANNIGQILQQQGDLDGALQYTRRALQIDETVYGSDHPHVAGDANNIGQILKARGDLAGALRYARRALEIGEKVYGPDHPTVAVGANNIGQILQDRGDLDGALQYTRRALQIDENVYGPGHPTIATLANNIGQILKARGDLDGALQYTRRALDIDEKVYGPDHPEVATYANNIGQILRDQGDLGGALEYTRRALKILQSSYGADNPLTKRAAANLRELERRSAAGV